MVYYCTRRFSVIIFKNERALYMKEPSAGFADAVRKAWGRDRHVAEVGMNEMFVHSKEPDHDEQVEHAVRVGILVGLNAQKGPDAFIATFTALLNENEGEEIEDED